VGVNRSIVEDGVDGFHADGEAAWTERLGRLVEDAGLRGRMGAVGRRKMERDYALSVSAVRLIEILRTTCPQKYREEEKGERGKGKG
jgi:glycosyltransferase involved in cell wall biosynthesis